MSRAAGDKIRERKSKAKLDRLLDIKKVIMESLHLLSGHDRSAAGQMKKSCVAPPTGYRLCQASDWFPLNRVDIVRRPDNAFHVVPVLMDPNSQLQSSCQTWPQDIYFGKPLGDNQSEPTPSHKAQSSSRTDYALHKEQAVDYFVQADRAPSGTACLEPAPLSWLRQGPDQTIGSEFRDASRLNTITAESHAQPLRSNQSRESPSSAPRHQEVQTDPEVMGYPLHADNANADIIRYLNQINDKTFGRRHQMDAPRRSACFSPRYDTYEERFCYRFHGSHCVGPERLYRSREYAALPTPPDFYKDGGQQFLGYTGPLRHDMRENGAPFTGDHHNNIPLSETIRSPSDDSGSVFSSETDSDFIFYPCTSLADSFKCMALVDSRNGSFLSPPGDLPENVQSWRSEIFGSSLDDITQQFYYDEDALSDDVFLDETKDYPTYVNEFLQDGAVREAATTHSFENPLYDSPNLTRPTIWSLREEPGEFDYTYRYADIDEVLQGYDHSVCGDDDGARAVTCHGDMGGATCFRADPGDEIHFDTETSIVSPGCDSRHGSSTADDHHHPADDHELTNVLDSLRRNSTQSKARKMWRQRRARAKKNLKSGHGESVTPPPSGLVFKFITPAPASGDDVKPLKGILKNKDSVSRAVNDAGVASNHSIDFTTPANNTVIQKCAEFDMEQESANPEAYKGGAHGSHVTGNGDIQEKFHFVPMQSESGQQNVIVRKNSVDIVRWNQSLQRRKKRHARKAEMSAVTASFLRIYKIIPESKGNYNVNWCLF
ncbi:hypothetical protein Btru_075599 [Bulinus truncatus]|nr:hypothetical protein Btru_075599 [Bulinus truncatus]